MVVIVMGPGRLSSRIPGCGIGKTRPQPWLSSLSLFFCFLFPQTHSLSFNLAKIGPQHQNVNITTFGDAKISSQGLQLTPIGENIDLKYRAGKAQWVTFLHLWDNSTGSLTDFDTHFVFAIDSGGSSSFTDGLTFFLADPKGSESSDITPGLAMGLPVNRDTYMGTSSFVAVEFDTLRNGPPLAVDPDNISPGTHVGIDVNSIISNVTAPLYCKVPGGIENEAWIRYDSSSHDLSVVFTGSTNTTRVKDTIHLIVDLRDYLPEWVTFGFLAGTGGEFEKHTVISWEFSSSFQVDPRPKKLPFGALVGIVVGSVVLVGGFGLVGFGLWKRSRENGKGILQLKMPQI
ncbi:hypothetical protein Vadar_032535 [Vaccinium darrowii]|uniref:Uncharacterized protein n=1 Tax=Vaccinium darrowii TaxID=229202 RepID=A0ACB7X679_9ERIC|nr:hypothetical protein Vadar_032535 [Vaccinium darrowii]